MVRIADLIRDPRGFQFARDQWLHLIEISLVILLAVVLARLSAGLISGSSPLTLDSHIMEQAGTPNNLTHAGNHPVSLPPSHLRNLFGTPVPARDEIPASESNIQETQLKLILRGILVNTETADKIALIAIPGSVENVYKVGDSISGAEIIRIEPGRVVIRHNGRVEALYLSIPKINADVNNNTGILDNQSGSFGASGIRQISENEIQISQQSLRQQLNNLPRLLRQAKAVPHSVNGQNMGFKMVEIQAGSVFEDLGLQTEDVIQSINGAPVRSTEDALNAYRQLRTSKSFQLGLLRDGRSMSLKLSVQ